MGSDSMAKWELVGHHGRMPTGRTRPVIGECVSLEDQSVRRKMLLKTTAGELAPSNLFAEYAGCRFAISWGLPAADSHLVYVSPDVAEAFGLAAPVAPGIAVGVEYREGLLLPLSPGHLSGELLASAADVFVFDLLFQNFDRPSHNPNCAHSSDGLFVYDFDLCFSFIKDIFPDLEPWRLAKYRSQAAAHVFYPELRRQREGLDFGGVGSRVVEFAANKMQVILSEVPGEWDRNAGLVSEHTTRLAEHASSLQLGIHEVLA